MSSTRGFNFDADSKSIFTFATKIISSIYDDEGKEIKLHHHCHEINEGALKTVKGYGSWSTPISWTFATRRKRLCPGNFRKFLLRPQRKESLEFMIICQLSLERKSSSRTNQQQQRRHCDEQKASAFIGSGHKQILWTSRVSILYNNINWRLCNLIKLFCR